MKESNLFCDIVKDSPANDGLRVNGWLDSRYALCLPYGDLFLILDGLEVCLAADCLLSMQDVWLRSYSGDHKYYEQAGEVLKFL